jgi:CRP-like cAMP-binding protein
MNMKQGPSVATPPTVPRGAPTASSATSGAVKKIWRGDPVVTRIASLIDPDAADLRSLRAVIETELTVTKRRDLVLDGYEFCKLCFVKNGYAARYKLLRNGKRQIVNFVLPGDVIGLPGSFLNRAANSVVAVTDMTLQICSLQAYVDLCYRQPKFGLLLGWLAAQEAAYCAEHVIDVGRRAPTERLAHLLLEIHSRLALVGLADDHAFTLPFTQELLSDALGLSVPHLNRTLGKLRAERLIAVNDRHVAFIDPKALQMLAQFQPAEVGRIPARDAGAIH